MTIRNPGVILAWATITVLAVAPFSAHAQDPRRLPFEFLYKGFEEWKLGHDQTRLQRDIAEGNTDQASNDMYKIQMDEWRINRVQRQIRRDMFLPGGPRVPKPTQTGVGATLVPHPQYPGYGYDPSNPTQLYPLAQQGSQDNPGQPASSTGATTPPAAELAEIVNTNQSGSAVSYVIDGATYTTDAGQRQKVSVTPSSTIVFTPGAGLNDQQYALSTGLYEFRSTGAGWALFRFEPKREVNTTQVAVPKNVIPKSRAKAATPHARPADGPQG